MPGVYQTKQRELILNYLATHQEHSFSAKEIYSACKRKGCPVGLATVYRQIDGLVQEGRVKKVLAEDNRGVRFQYLKDLERPGVFYCKCDRCGKITHADCKLLDQIAIHLDQEHGFCVDTGRSVLYGRCNACK